MSPMYVTIQIYDLENTDFFRFFILHKFFKD